MGPSLRYYAMLFWLMLELIQDTFPVKMLKMSVNTGNSWIAQCFRVLRETESGLCLLKSLLAFLTRIESIVVAGGTNGALRVDG